MTIIHDLLQPVDNITSGIGGAISGLGHGVGSAIHSTADGFSSLYKGLGGMLKSPLTLILLIIGAVVLFEFAK